MRYILSIIGLIAGFALFKYRERVGQALGDSPWMDRFGGSYGIVMITAVFLFFYAIATLTNTWNILFSPVETFLRAVQGTPKHVEQQKGPEQF